MKPRIIVDVGRSPACASNGGFLRPYRVGYRRFGWQGVLRPGASEWRQSADSGPSRSRHGMGRFDPKRSLVPSHSIGRCRPVCVIRRCPSRDVQRVIRSTHPDEILFQAAMCFGSAASASKRSKPLSPHDGTTRETVAEDLRKLLRRIAVNWRCGGRCIILYNGEMLKMCIATSFSRPNFRD